MLKKDLELYKLFEKILKAHFLTDYSSIDFLYPPHFCWDKFDSEEFNKVKNRFLAGNYLLYVHFPFCRSKCKFCRQFSLASNNKKLFDNYVDLVTEELRLYTEAIDISSLANIYLGGGTPTLFPLDKFFEKLYSSINVHPLAQINVESTPESLSVRKLKMLKKMGVNRLLIGAQSLDPTVLKSINRFQRKAYFIKIYYLAKEIGIPVVNIELVAGLPGQSPKSFFEDLDTIIRLKPESIHFYGYINSPTTFFYKKGYRKDQEQVSAQEEMVSKGKEMLQAANYYFRGDDYCLDGKDRFRNHTLVIPSHFSKLDISGPISLGMSAAGRLALNRGQSVRIINTMDYRKYKKRIEKREFPIDKFFLLNSDEQKRHSLVRACRYGSLEKNKNSDTFRKYKKEIEYLKRQNRVKIKKQGRNIKLVFSPQDAMTYSKIFYSPKVLKRCRRIIGDRYPEIDSLELDF